MTIDQSINGYSHSEKKKQFGEREQDWSVQKYECPQRFHTIQAERPFHLLTQEEAKGALILGCAVFRGNKKVKSWRKVINHVKSGAEKSKLRLNFKDILRKENVKIEI